MEKPEEFTIESTFEDYNSDEYINFVKYFTKLMVENGYVLHYQDMNKISKKYFCRFISKEKYKQIEWAFPVKDEKYWKEREEFEDRVAQEFLKQRREEDKNNQTNPKI